MSVPGPFVYIFCVDCCGPNMTTDPRCYSCAAGLTELNDDGVPIRYMGLPVSNGEKESAWQTTGRKRTTTHSRD